MRVSYEWLKEMVDVPADPQDLVAEFVRTGTEVEGVEDTGASLKNVVTGHVLEAVPHPDSDHMHVCTVDVGAKNVDAEGNPAPLQIVCGAPNMRTGLNVAVAMIGAVLPGDFEIKKSKLRGVESCGMCCSGRELGLDNDHSGILELPEDVEPGQDFASWAGIGDTVIDCEMTPNRPDCLSMTGVAVEVSAMLDEDTHFNLPAIKEEAGTPTADLVDVRIDDATLCPRYTARVVRGVKIGPSPDWLAKRVVAAGARTINNVVDVTNYVMFLTGQPLHAFDLGKLTEVDGKRHIVVRAAREGEVLVTLDGQERVLNPENTVISVSPEVGERARSGQSIVAKVADPYIVPDVAGMYLQDAQDAIANAGLTSEYYYVNTRDYPDGAIMGTQPAAGEKVTHDTVVSIQIARARAAELEDLTREYLAPGAHISMGAYSYEIETLNSVEYTDNDMVAFSATARPYTSILGETVYISARSINGTIHWSEDNHVISIS